MFNRAALFIEGTKTERYSEKSTGFRVRRPKFKSYLCYLTALCPEAHCVWTLVSTSLKWGFKKAYPWGSHKNVYKCIQKSFKHYKNIVETWVVIVAFQLTEVGLRCSEAWNSVSQKWWPRGLCEGHEREIPLRGATGTSTGFCGIAELSKFCGKIEERVEKSFSLFHLITVNFISTQK